MSLQNVVQAQHIGLLSQRTGAELNRLSCDVNELEFAMEVGPARQGINRFSRSVPMPPDAGQDNQAQEKRWNLLLISPLDDGLTMRRPPDGTATHDWRGRLHRQPHLTGAAGGRP